MSRMLPEIIREHALNAPSAHAFTYLTDGERSESAITRGALDLRARAIAAELQARGAVQQPAVIMLPSGLDAIAAVLGCWFAGAIAVPAPVPRGHRTGPRVSAILRDARPRLIVSTGVIHRQMQKLDDTGKQMEWLNVEDIAETAANEWSEPKLHPNAPAMVQYTSGSTGDPRGVMLSHGNIVENQRIIEVAFEQTERVVGWLPLYHDMGLIGNVLHPLFLGTSCILMSPAHFIQKPVRWLEAISRYRGTTSGGPNFAYDLCVDSITDDDMSKLDLSSWSVAFNGSEPVRQATLERFGARFAVAGFRMESFRVCYGLAEATLLVSCTRAAAQRSPVAGVVGCGIPLRSQEVIVADPATRLPCQSGVTGEIWVSGPNIGLGYWGRPKDTETTFQARVAGANTPTYLRTGDLGFMIDGELFINGRLKDVIILRGRNLHAEDVEAAIHGCHPALVRGGCAAFAASEEDGERLVVVQEVRMSVAPELHDSILAIRRAVAASHQVQVDRVVLIRARSMPRTSSGKVRRRRCKEDYRAGKLAVVSEWNATTAHQGDGNAPRNPLEEVVAILWAQALGLKVVGINEAFLDLGGDSLAALRIIGNVFDVFKVQLTLEDLLQNPTVAALAARIEESQGSASGEGAADLEDKSRVPLSVEQYPVWMMEQLFPGTAAYVIPVVFQITGLLDVAVFEKSVQAVVERHGALRYAIDDQPGGPVQVRSCNSIRLNLVDVSGEPRGVEQLIDAEARKPFDLQKGPLARVTLFRHGPELHTCAFMMHHLVCDNESIRILLRDLSALYNSLLHGRRPLLPELPGQPVRTQSSHTVVRSSAGSRLNLGADRSASRVPSFAGAAEGSMLKAPLVCELQRIAREEQVTIAMVMLASFAAFIHRYAEERTFVLGCPVSTRTRIETEHAVGLFAKIAPVAFAFEERVTFRQLLHQTRASVLAAWRLVSAAAEGPPQSESQVLFSFLNQTQHMLTLDGVEAAIMPHTVRSSVAELCLSIMQSDAGVRCDFEYRTELFDAASIKLMFAKYLLLLDSLVAEPRKPIADCDFLLAEERALSKLLPLEVTL